MRTQLGLIQVSSAAQSFLVLVSIWSARYAPFQTADNGLGSRVFSAPSPARITHRHSDTRGSEWNPDQGLFRASQCLHIASVPVSRERHTNHCARDRALIGRHLSVYSTRVATEHKRKA
eukprot:2391630-Rhodomonas_salina.1